MRITCVGGGPAGLYFSLLMKLRDSRHEIQLFERSATGATQGWAIITVLEDENIYRQCTARASEIAAYFSWERTAREIAGIIRDGKLTPRT